MKINKLELDLSEILVDVIKLDKNLQDSIKQKVKENIINKITDSFTDEYFETKWNSDKEELRQVVLDELSEEREEFIKRILKSFSEQLSYFSSDKRKKAYEEFKKQVEIITR